MRGDLAEGRRLVADGGILCGDDLELRLDQCDEAHVRAHREDDFVQVPDSEIGYHPGVTLAVAEMLGEVASHDGFWFTRRQGDAFVGFSLRGAEALLPEHTGEDEAVLRAHAEKAGLILVTS